MSGHGRELVRVLQAQFRNESIMGAEIGVSCGETSACLLASLPNLFLMMVDSWSAHDEASNYYRSGDSCARLSAVEQLQKRRLAESRTAEQAGRRRVLAMPSIAAAAEIADRSLDFVFIDADHTYEAVQADIQAWRTKLRAPGVLSGHDYGARRDRKGIWGVSRAVQEFCAANAIQPQLARHGVWWVRLDGHASLR